LAASSLFLYGTFARLADTNSPGFRQESKQAGYAAGLLAEREISFGQHPMLAGVFLLSNLFS
jgi:hypothetical protein